MKGCAHEEENDNGKVMYMRRKMTMERLCTSGGKWLCKGYVHKEENDNEKVICSWGVKWQWKGSVHKEENDNEKVIMYMRRKM